MLKRHLRWLGLTSGSVFAVALLYGMAAYLFDDATPPDLADKTKIRRAEHRFYPEISEIGQIIMVERGDYILVSSDIEFDNLALYHRQGTSWGRLTPRGWLYNVDKMAIWRAGAPITTANALANGMRRLWHLEGHIPDQ